ncbi:MAG: pyridoxal phosphate-dependent aminotransferase [Bdellovibrionales bacterium]|nr:pyridoxal phosphate-dependent aminotransferase [Bdellovibrionales bacterium]
MNHPPLRPLSQRARNTPPSPIRRLSGLALAAKHSGAKVYHLNIGQPDIFSPDEFLTSLPRFVDKVVAYEASQGSQALRVAWSQYMNQLLDLSTTPEHFLITMGASEALIFLFMALCDAGDEILIFDPTYANYIGFAALTGVNLTPIHSKLDDGFCLPSIDSIVEGISEKTRAILLCNPNNPTGTTYTRDELKMLLHLCEERNLYFIVDETYREIVFDGREPLSILHLAPQNKRIAIVDSLSKRFSLCGARIGCLYSENEELLEKCLSMAQARLSAPSVEQFAATELLTSVDETYLHNTVKEYEKRRDVLCSRLSEMEGVTFHKPGGAFYTVVRLPVENAETFSSYLLREFRLNGETLFIAPAAGFYMGQGKGINKVRMAFVLNEQSLLRAGDILEAGLKAYQET